MSMESQDKKSTEQKTKLGGRKKGTPNHERVEVVQLPVRCPSCGSTNRKVQAKTGDERFMEVDRLFNGTVYNRQVIRLCVCQCGQHLTLHELTHE